MKRFCKLLFLGLYFIVPDLVAQDKIYVTFLSNAENQYQLNTLSKITFSNGSFKMKYADNSVITYQNSLIRQIAFAPYVPNATEVTTADNLLQIYPNPAKDFIYLKNYDRESGKLTIYDLHGVLLMTKSILSFSEAIDISSLMQGLYLLKVDGQIIKFSKL